MQNSKGPPFIRSPAWGLMLRLILFLSLSAITFSSCGSVPLHPNTEATLLSRIEKKHDLFPTYVFGQSYSGNPVVYKPSLGGLRDFRKLFVLQTDAYIIDLLLTAKNKPSFTLVLDLSSLSGRMRRPTLEMWESLRTVVDPLPPNEKASVEKLVAQIFERCEAVVVINASTLVKLLKPIISLMFPVQQNKLFVSTNRSALYKTVKLSEIPKPYNLTAVEALTDNAQSIELYQLLNERAGEILKRPLNIYLGATAGAEAGAEGGAEGGAEAGGSAVQEVGVVSKEKVENASEKAGGGEEEDDDDFDDID